MNGTVALSSRSLTAASTWWTWTASSVAMRWAMDTVMSESELHADSEPQRPRRLQDRRAPEARTGPDVLLDLVCVIGQVEDVEPDRRAPAVAPRDALLDAGADSRRVREARPAHGVGMDDFGPHARHRGEARERLAVLIAHDGGKAHVAWCPVRGRPLPHVRTIEEQPALGILQRVRVPVAIAQYERIVLERTEPLGAAQPHGAIRRRAEEHQPAG